MRDYEIIVGTPRSRNLAVWQCCVGQTQNAPRGGCPMMDDGAKLYQSRNAADMHQVESLVCLYFYLHPQLQKGLGGIYTKWAIRYFDTKNVGRIFEWVITFLLFSPHSFNCTSL